VAQDDYYYEIQLTNKQLVFYFMAGATGLILSFLAGVMVGRGVDAVGEVQASKPVAEERIVAEQAPVAPPSTTDLTYAQRLDGEKNEDALEKPRPATVADAAGKAPAPAAVAPPPVTRAKPAPEPVTTPAPAKAVPSPRPTPSPKASPASPRSPEPKTADVKAAKPTAGGGNFTIQVGAFRDKASAESVATRLKGKGFAAFVISPEGDGGGLFNVRVGSYTARSDAERVQVKLRDEEKFTPFIVKQ
jgi:cell division septation protein DedD